MSVWAYMGVFSVLYLYLHVINVVFTLACLCLYLYLYALHRQKRDFPAGINKVFFIFITIQQG